MKRLQVILLGLAVWTGRAATPATEIPSRRLSLAECLQLALEHNLDLQIERKQPDLMRYTLSGAYGAYDPTLQVDGGRHYVDEPLNLDPKKNNFDSPYQQSVDGVGTGLSGLLPTGLSYSLGSRTEFLTTDTQLVNNQGEPNSFRHTNQVDTAMAITLQQPLLKDFWIDENRYQISVNKQNLKIAELALVQAMMNVVTRAEVAYYELIYTQQEISVRELALAQARQLLAENERRVQMGLLPPLGVQDAAAQVETARANLLAAQLTCANQQNVLKGLIGDNFRDWADVRLEPSDPLEATETPVRRDESWARALAQRPDVRQFQLELAKHDVQVRYRFNQLFPSLDVVGSYGSHAVDHTYSEAWDQMHDFSHPHYSYGVVLSYPLSNRAARSAYRASQTEREASELRLKQLEQDVLIQVDDAVNFVESAFQRVSATRQARIHAEAALAAEQQKLANGESTSFVVLEMQNRLTSAHGAEIRALADYHEALVRLAFADGSTLERNRLDVQFKPAP